MAALAFNPTGDLLVAYDRVRTARGSDTRTFITRLLPRGGRLGPPVAVGRAKTHEDVTPSPPLTASLAADRHALVGWDVVPCEYGLRCFGAVLGVGRLTPAGGHAFELARVPGFRFGDEPHALPGRVLVSAGDRDTAAWN